MKKLSTLIESTWGEMRHKSSGKVVRKEEEVFLKLGVSEMYDYLKDAYKDKVYWMDGDKKSCVEDKSIGIDPVDGISIYFEYGDDDKLEKIGMFYTIRSFSREPKEYPEFFKKLSDAFDVSVFMDKPEFSKQWSIKPKYGELTNKTIIEVLDFFLNTEINESVWGDMRKRSSGDSARKEMTMEEFKNHLEKRYRFTKKYEDRDFPMISYNLIYTSIGIPAFAVKSDRHGTSYFHLSLNMVNDGEYVLTLSKTAQKLHIFDVLRNEYIMTDCEKSWDYDIKPKKGMVDKEFFITVLDFINANLQSPEESVVERKPITESVWGDMRQRSAGNTVKKEDDISHLDRDGLYEHIYDVYEQVSEFPQPLKGQTNPGHEYFAIGLFRSKDTSKIYRLYANFEGKLIDNIFINASLACCNEFKDVLFNRFTVIEDNFKGLVIQDKKGRVTNQLCMDLIQTIIENTSKPLLKKRDV